jgi:hypothetical protein
MGKVEVVGSALARPRLETASEVHTMSDVRQFGGRGLYEIRVKGKLDLRWSDWFDGFSITPVGDGETLLIGSVADQAALHGVLHKIRDLGLPLLSVQRLRRDG